jgi:hypothetical protein
MVASSVIEPGCETCLNDRRARGFGSEIHHLHQTVVEQNATTLGKPGSVRCIDFRGRGFQ